MQLNIFNFKLCLLAEIKTEKILKKIFLFIKKNVVVKERLISCLKTIIFKQNRNNDIYEFCYLLNFFLYAIISFL